MKNPRHHSRYKPGHGRKHGIKASVSYSPTLRAWHGAIWQTSPTKLLYTTGLCTSDTEAHAMVRQWRVEHGYHKKPPRKPHAPPADHGPAP